MQASRLVPVPQGRLRLPHAGTHGSHASWAVVLVTTSPWAEISEPRDPRTVAWVEGAPQPQCTCVCVLASLQVGGWGRPLLGVQVIYETDGLAEQSLGVEWGIQAV